MDKRLFFLLNMAQHALFTHADHTCRTELDVSVTQLGLLLYIKKHPDSQQKDAATALGLNKPAITGLINRLSDKSLIRRTPCPRDGRAIQLTLTPTGDAITETASPLITAMNERLCEGFSDDEINTVLRFLTTLLKRY